MDYLQTKKLAKDLKNILFAKNFFRCTSHLLFCFQSKLCSVVPTDHQIIGKFGSSRLVFCPEKHKFLCLNTFLKKMAANCPLSQPHSRLYLLFVPQFEAYRGDQKIRPENKQAGSELVQAQLKLELKHVLASLHACLLTCLIYCLLCNLLTCFIFAIQSKSRLMKKYASIRRTTDNLSLIGKLLT